MEEDTEGLADLRDCLMTPEVALTTVDLLYNRIGKNRVNANCLYLDQNRFDKSYDVE